MASTGCTADATALSSRAVTAAALRCSTQTNFNLPASTKSGCYSSSYYFARPALGPARLWFIEWEPALAAGLTVTTLDPDGSGLPWINASR